MMQRSSLQLQLLVGCLVHLRFRRGRGQQQQGEGEGESGHLISPLWRSWDPPGLRLQHPLLLARQRICMRPLAVLGRQQLLPCVSVRRSRVCIPLSFYHKHC